MLSTFVANNSNKDVLAVQNVVGIIVCKSCKIGIPSPRRAKEHLISNHRIDPSLASTLANSAAAAEQAAFATPHSLREAYKKAPIPVPGTDQPFGPEEFYAPLKGLQIEQGYRCPLCPPCYTTERYMRKHFSTDHEDHHLSVDQQWNRSYRNGTVRIQTLFKGNTTSYFPVSASTPIGELSVPPCSSSSDDKLQQIPVYQEEPPSSTTAPPTPQQRQASPTTLQTIPLVDPSLDDSGLLLHSDEKVQLLFAEMDAVLSANHDPDVVSARMNVFLARTKFNVLLRNQGIDMPTAANYSGLIGDRTAEETQVVNDVTEYLLNVPTLLPDIAPSVLHDINLRGHAEFSTVSKRSAERYARNFARVVISALRVQQHHPALLSQVVADSLTAYRTALSSSSSLQLHRIDLLHNFLKSISLHRLDKMDSPKSLFVRNFISFASVMTKSRSQTDSFRYATSTDISPILAALLYGASSCAINEIRRLGIQAEALSVNHSLSQDEATISRDILKDRLEEVISSLDESQNSAASFIRKHLTIANTISKMEDVDFIFEDCETHPFCGIVRNVHVKMTALGDMVKQLQEDIRSSFTTLLYGSSLPEEFFSHLAGFDDLLHDKSNGFSFLNYGANKEKIQNYAVWLFNQLTQVNPVAKAEFNASPSEHTTATPCTDVIEVFGNKLKRRAVQKWLLNVQEVQDNLLACTHISSGSPGRATELETLQLFNTEHELRNLYISQGRVCIVTRYCKTRAIKLWDRTIPRFPDPETSKLFLTYLVLFRTLESIFLKSLYGVMVMKTHMEGLFVERGANYTACRIRDKIKALLQAHSIPIEFYQFRHYSAYMVPAVTANSPKFFRTNLIEEATEIAHLQAGHSAQVAEHVYGRKASDIPSIPQSALTRYRHFSTEWHRHLGLLPTAPHPIPIPSTTTPLPPLPSTTAYCNAEDLQTALPALVHSISEQVSQTVKTEFRKLASRLKRSLPDTPTEQPHASATRRPFWDRLRIPQDANVNIHQELLNNLPSLCAMTKNPLARFTSAMQLQVSLAVGEAQHDLMVLMPTGSGKTVSVLFPIFLERNYSSSVIIVPLAALVHEHVATCRNFNISVATWQQRKENVQVYVITMNHTVDELQAFFARLQNHCNLRRIIVDEVHLLLLWQLFRTSIRRLPNAFNIRASNVQLILLSATVPPNYREKLLDLLRIPSLLLYAQPTVRRNLQYRVIDTSPTPANLFLSHETLMTTALCQQVLQVVFSLLEQDGGRIMIFTLYQKEAERLQTELQNFLRQRLRQTIEIVVYHGGMNSDDLDKLFKLWKHNSFKILIVICTKSFGTGVHVADVRAVFHFGGPEGLLQYAQESGRAGRDGKPALCVIIYNRIYAGEHSKIVNNSQTNPSLSEQDHLEQQAHEWKLMLDYMEQTTRCRKNWIFEYIDGYGPGMCLFDTTTINCDVCEELSSLPVPHTSLSNPCTFQQLTTLPSNSPRTPLSYQPSSSPPGSSTQRTGTTGPLPVNRRISFTQSQSQDEGSNNNAPSSSLQINVNVPELRSTCHSLKTLCVPCLVFDNKHEPDGHKCRNMRNRCLRCFLQGHQVSSCNYFRDGRPNFCYGCWLSQIKGQNVHQKQDDGQKEFGSSCFMKIARRISYAYWARGPEFQEQLSKIFQPSELEKFRRTRQAKNVELASNTFFDEWLKSEPGTVPNLALFLLWWKKHFHSE